MLLSTTALLFVSIFSISVHGADNVVKTESGEVQGVTAKTLLNQRQFYSFRGIRYAQPPIGNLRFKVKEILCFWEKENVLLIICLFIYKTKLGSSKGKPLDWY